jgi:hypothetical protein
LGLNIRKQSRVITAKAKNHLNSPPKIKYTNPYMVGDKAREKTTRFICKKLPSSGSTLEKKCFLKNIIKITSITLAAKSI